MIRTKIKCEICGQEISKSNYTKHLRRHNLHPETFEIPTYRVNHEGLECQFCGKICKNDNSLRNHERLCKLNPNRQLTTYEKGIDPFENSRVNGSLTTCLGQAYEDDLHNKLCPHCNKWFTSKTIGIHIAKCHRLHNEDRFAYVGHQRLDVTVNFINEYLETHKQCEICGKTVEEVIKYKGKTASKRHCIDHNHQNGKFRGVLCQVCNRQLGWYEKHKESVDNYLTKMAP